MKICTNLNLDVTGVVRDKMTHISFSKLINTKLQYFFYYIYSVVFLIEFYFIATKRCKMFWTVCGCSLFELEIM